MKFLCQSSLWYNTYDFLFLYLIDYFGKVFWCTQKGWRLIPGGVKAYKICRTKCNWRPLVLCILHGVVDVDKGRDNKVLQKITCKANTSWRFFFRKKWSWWSRLEMHGLFNFLIFIPSVVAQALEGIVALYTDYLTSTIISTCYHQYFNLFSQEWRHFTWFQSHNQAEKALR